MRRTINVVLQIDVEDYSSAELIKIEAEANRKIERLRDTAIDVLTKEIKRHVDSAAGLMGGDPAHREIFAAHYAARDAILRCCTLVRAALAETEAPGENHDA